MMLVSRHFNDLAEQNEGQALRRALDFEIIELSKGLRC